MRPTCTNNAYYICTQGPFTILFLKFAKKKIDAEVKIVISNNKNSEYLKSIKNKGFEIKFLQSKNFKSKELYEEEINKILKKKKVELICLAGYMKILSKTFPFLLSEKHV